MYVFFFPPSDSKVMNEILNRKVKRKERMYTRKLISNVLDHLCQRKGHCTNFPAWQSLKVILPCPQSLARAIPQKGSYLPVHRAHLDRCLGEFLAPLPSPCLLVPTGRSDGVYRHDTLFMEKRHMMLGDCTGDKQPRETGANNSEDDQVWLLQQWNNYA